MTRKFLSNLGITEDDVITKILNAHHDVVQPLKDDLDTAKKDLKTAQDTIKNAPPPDTEDWKKKYEDEAAAHETDKTALADWQKKHADEAAAHKTTRDTYAAEKDAADVDNKVAALLKGANLNDNVIPKALKLYDRTIVKRDKDGAIENADKVLEAFKTEWGGFFGEVQQKGADVGTPPAGGGKSETDFSFSFTPVRAVPQSATTKG